MLTRDIQLMLRATKNKKTRLISFWSKMILAKGSDKYAWNHYLAINNTITMRSNYYPKGDILFNQLIPSLIKLNQQQYSQPIFGSNQGWVKRHWLQRFLAWILKSLDNRPTALFSVFSNSRYFHSIIILVFCVVKLVLFPFSTFT